MDHLCLIYPSYKDKKEVVKNILKIGLKYGLSNGTIFFENDKYTTKKKRKSSAHALVHIVEQKRHRLCGLNKIFPY